MPKQSNRKLRVQRVLDLRKGSRTSPVQSGKIYKRRPKHAQQEGAR